MRVSDYIFERLSREGIKKSYLVTGRGALFLTDGLAKCEKIEAICCHHEQAAGYAAVADSQLNENLGLAVVSTGCASTNSLTPVLSAWQDGLPVLFLSGQHIKDETTYFTGLNIRTYGQQEANIIDIVKSITKFSAMATCAKEVPELLEKAITSSKTGRKGPVWLDIPLDIQSAQIDIESLSLKECKDDAEALESNSLNKVKSLISNSKRPVILIGSGIRSSNTQDELRKFVEVNQIPVVFTASAVDTYPADNLYSVGSVGSMGCSREGAFTLQNSDLIIVLGNRLPSIVTGLDFCKFGRDAKVIVIDIDREEHQKKGVNIDIFLQMDLKKFFQEIGSERITPKNSKWIEATEKFKEKLRHLENFKLTEKVDLYSLSNTLSKEMSDDSILITDSGFIEVILPTNINFSPSRRAIHPVSQGAMGFAIPAIIGAYDKGNPDREIICVVGDGTIMMNLQELQTIKHHNIPAKIIVVNNNIYSIIRRRQKELFRKRTIGTGIEDGLSVPNFQRVADTFGLQYTRVDSENELEKKISKFLSQKGSGICEILGRLDQEYIEISHTRASNGKFVRRPLEDQWPFIDRDLFNELMIVEAIDQ